MESRDDIEHNKKVNEPEETEEHEAPPAFSYVNPSDKKKPRFLEKYRELRTIHQTCKAFRLSRNTFIKWRNTDPVFKEKFEEIENELYEALEVNAYKRALSGSDLLTIFLLKANNPEKYRERIKHEIDHRFILDISAQVTAIIRRVVPNDCPHCKTHFGLTNKIAQELESLSARLALK